MSTDFAYNSLCIDLHRPCTGAALPNTICIGGTNDAAQVPVKALIAAATSVLKGEQLTA
jgi:hypothetical protein